MSHMVIYRTADGQPGYHQADLLDDAVQFVERLRNTDGVDQARIFHMEEVTFDFKPYFRVEVGNEPAAAISAPAFEAPAPPPVEPLISATHAALAPAPLDERSWMDMPVAEEPVQAPLLASEPLMAESPLMASESPLMAADSPLMSEPSPFADAHPFGDHEIAEPVFDAVPPPPPPPPAIESDESVSSGNGMGARRGLFGR